MDLKECVKLLKRYNLWRRGRGKKYSQPGFPFSPTELGIAIDTAIANLSYGIEPSMLDALVGMAKRSCESEDDKKVVRYAVRLLRKLGKRSAE